jgi:hypothetical protein
MSRVATRSAWLAVLGLLAGAPAESQQLTDAAASQLIGDLQQQQCEIQADVSVMMAETGADRDVGIQRLRARKDQMIGEVRMLEAVLAQVVPSDSGGSASLREAAALIRDSQLRVLVRYSQDTLERWDAESVASLERTIQDRLQALRSRLSPSTGAFACPAVS